MTNNISEKVGKATAWSSVTELMAKLVAPLVNIVLARLLLPEAFGIVATITLVISFAEIFTDAGFQKYLIQHEFESEDQLNKSTNVAFWTNLGVSAIICLLIFIFRDQLASLVGNPGLGNSISIASLLIVFYAFSSIQTARYKRDLDFRTLFFARIGTALIPLAVTIPLAFLLRNYWALMIGNFASQLFSAVFLTLKSKWKIRFYYSFSLFRQMFSFTAWTLLEQLSIWLTSNVDIFIVGKFLSSHYLGLYKTSISTVSAYMGLVGAAVVPVLFSTLSRYQNDDRKFKDTFYTFQRLTATLIIPMGVGVFVFSDLVTKILLGANWTEASGFIGWWGLTSALVIIFSHFSSEVIRSKGKPKVSLILQLTQIAALVPVLLLVKDASFKTLYVARSLVRFEIIFASLGVICLMFGFKLKKLIANVFPSVLSSLIMGGVGLVLISFGEGMLWQIASVCVCITVYFSVLFICFPRVRREIFGIPIVRKVLSKIKPSK